VIDTQYYMEWSASNNMAEETCWTFVSKVLFEVFQITLPKLKAQEDIFLHQKEVIKQQQLNGSWNATVDPKSGDVVLLMLRGIRPHVGIMNSANTFLHFSETDRMVKMGSCQSFQWRNRIEGFYRHS